MSQALHPRIVEVVAALEAAQEHMHETLAGIPAELLSRKPADGGWSVEETVDHLARTEDGLGRVIGGMLKQLEGTVDTETDPIAPTLARFNVSEPVRKVPAPDRVLPAGMPLAEALAAQAAARARVIEALRAGSGRALHTQTFPHPFFGPLNGYQWALLNAQHQRRHCVQMRNTVGTFA